MKGLSLTQPWATLVAIGAKRIETRSWPTSYRGPIAIHAAKKFPDDCREVCLQPPFSTVLKAAGIRMLGDLPRGVIVATASLRQCWRTDSLVAINAIRPAGFDELLTEHERAFGDYAPGRYGFVLEHASALHTPVPCRGALGLWPIGAGLLEQIREAVNP